MKIININKVIKEIEKFYDNSCMDDQAYGAIDECIQIIKDNIKEDQEKISTRF